MISPVPSDRRWTAITTILFALLMARVTSLYAVYSDTYDEYAHISEPLRWIETGRFLSDGFQAPLPRLTIALGPKLLGFDSSEPWLSGSWINQDVAEYWRCLTIARIGVLPFAALLFWTVALWARSLYGDRGSIAAAALMSFSPTVVGHASLATLDVPGAAGFVLALAGLWRWVRKPTHTSAAIAGAAAGFAQVTKFSALAFLMVPYLFVLLYLSSRRLVSKQLISQCLVMSASAFVIIWASYGCEIGPIHSYRHERAAGTPDELAIGAGLQGVRVPAPAFWGGFVDLAYLRETGHPATFLSESRRDGWAAYFPAALILKATPPMLLLGLLGALMAARRARDDDPIGLFLVVAAAAGILLASMPSHINIGVRHVMPIFPALALLGGSVFSGTARLSGRQLAAAVLLFWHMAESLYAHPNYIAYFTPIARSRDYHYLSDSNLAWGQDRARLVEWLRAHQNRSVHIVGGEGIGILRTIQWVNAPETAEWLIMDANVASIILSEQPDSPLIPLLHSGPTERIGRSILVFRREAPRSESTKD